jgi:hypothetical protein
MRPGPAGGQARCAAQLWLGHLAVDFRVALAHFSAVRDVQASDAPSALLAQALASRARCLMNLDQIPEADAEARRALELAQDLGDLPGEAYALHVVAAAALYARDFWRCAGLGKAVAEARPGGHPRRASPQDPHAAGYLPTLRPRI